jgi:hypothetical protein
MDFDTQAKVNKLSARIYTTIEEYGFDSNEFILRCVPQRALTRSHLFNKAFLQGRSPSTSRARARKSLRE